MTAMNLLPVALLGGILGLDVVSFPQAMISRPLVAATIAGAFAGSAERGLLIGVILELFALEMLAVGASRYPEWGSASVVGGGLFAASDPLHTVPASLAGAVFAALVVAWLGGWSMYALRRLNGIWARRRVPLLERGDAGVNAALQLRGLTADFVRGALMATLGTVAFAPVVHRIGHAAAVGDVTLLAVLWALAIGAGASVVWRHSQGAPGSAWWFAGGLIAGLALLVL